MEFTPILNPKQWREEYYELFKSHGVTTAREYYNYYTSNTGSLDRDIQKLLDRIDNNLSGFERIYPGANQDLALIFVNPGLSWRESSPTLDDNYQLSKAPPADWTRRCAISMDGGFKYLTENNKDRSGFDRLRDVLHQIGKETSLLSGLTATLDRPVEFFADIYYTNWYKFATGGVGNINEIVKKSDSFVSQNLRQELSIVDPELALVFGRLPWENGIRPYSTPIGNAPANADISDAQNRLYKCELQDTSFYVIPYNHPSDRNRSRAVGHKSDTLAESLRHFRAASD